MKAPTLYQAQSEFFKIVQHPRVQAGVSNGMRAYHESYWARLESSLREDYPQCAQLLGFKRFQKLAEEYFTKHPSRSNLLNETGQHFPQFIKKHPLQKTFPWLFELSSLEWELFKKNFIQISHNCLSTDEVTPCLLSLRNDVSLFKSSYPLTQLFQAKRAPRNLKKARYTSLLYQNKNGFCAWKTLSAGEAKIFERLLQRRSFSILRLDTALRPMRPEPHDIEEFFKNYAAFFVKAK